MHSRPRAKVNLTLEVAARDSTGFHPLQSVILRVGLSDELVVAFGEGADTLSVTGASDVPIKGNLVLAAIAATRKALGHDLPPLVAHLDKRIPIGGGLGGGSSDAAAAVDAALQMWGAALAPNVLDAIAGELGSDVFFFMRGGEVALVGGRGEQVERLPAIEGGLGVLLVSPRHGLPTARVFDAYDDLDTADQPQSVTAGLASAMRTGMDGVGLTAWSERLRDANDLWRAAVVVEPHLADLRTELEHVTGRAWLMSGSGASLFALYPTASESAEAGRALAAAESAVVGDAIINAVDLVGPDPVWRYPWHSEQ